MCVGYKTAPDSSGTLTGCMSNDHTASRMLPNVIAVDDAYVVETLARLVSINSVNPAFGDGSTNECVIAGYVGEELDRLGAVTTRYETEPGRTSVVGAFPGAGGGRSLLLYAHLDTVGVEGMAAPFTPEVREGRMYGRGVYDMKCGLAACLAAAKALADSPARSGDVLVAAVADEERASIGIQDVLRSVRADAAIVTEPTELRVCLAHKGFAWVEVLTRGRAAHGSRFEEGIDANMLMGRFLGRLELLQRELRLRTPHPMVGPPSLHAPMLRGGTGTSTYAAGCRVEIERRTVPGETSDDVMAEVRELVDALAREDPVFQASVNLMLARGSFEVAPSAAVVQAVERAATEVLGRAPERIGVPYWMDAAFLAAAGIDTVVIGPSGAGAHALEEWVDLSSVTAVAKILAQAALEFCG
jgi:acetylornithine deacetylase